MPDPAHGFARNGITFGTQTETIPPSTRFGFPCVCNIGKFLKSCVKSLTRRSDYGINEATPLMAGRCLAEAVLPDRRPRGLCRKRRVESKERSRRSLNRHMGSLFSLPDQPPSPNENAPRIRHGAASFAISIRANPQVPSRIRRCDLDVPLGHQTARRARPFRRE